MGKLVTSPSSSSQVKVSTTLNTTMRNTGNGSVTVTDQALSGIIASVLGLQAGEVRRGHVAMRVMRIDTYLGGTIQVTTSAHQHSLSIDHECHLRLVRYTSSQVDAPGHLQPMQATSRTPPPCRQSFVSTIRRSVSSACMRAYMPGG